jgi:hypothetical protein
MESNNMDLMILTRRAVATSAALLVLGTSLYANSAEERTPGKISYTGLNIKLLSPADSTQRKNKVTIIVDSKESGPKLYYKLKLFPKNQLLVLNDRYKYTRYLIPFVKGNVSTMLNVTVINGLDDVLRMGETVLSIKMDGEDVPIDSGGKKKFANAVILPHSNQSFTLKVPLPANKNQCQTFEFGIYEVVTETDSAGNPSKREFFRWTYKCDLTQQTSTVYTIKDEVSMTRGEARAQDGTVVNADDVPEAR